MIKKLLRPLVKIAYIFIDFYHRLLQYRELVNELKPLQLKYKNNKNTVFIIFTPEYDNLGDHAIALAETELLKSLNIEYVEISNFLLLKINKHNLFRFFNQKTLLIQGGGYLGSLWLREEKLIRKVVKYSPKSTIYAFPSTIYYENTDIGKREFEESKKVYNGHKNITFCAREKTTYETMKKAYKNVKLVPDMAFLLNECKEKNNRKGCLICLRKDLEKTLSQTQQQLIHTQAETLFGENVNVTDMCVDHNIPQMKRTAELETKFAEFRNAELVITDRLHGMIFCAVTGTPCIVVNSKSPKVKGCYEWIKHLEYIKFVDDVSKITDTFRSIPKKEFQYDNTSLQPYYDILKTDIKNILR